VRKRQRDPEDASGSPILPPAPVPEADIVKYPWSLEYRRI